MKTTIINLPQKELVLLKWRLRLLNVDFLVGVMLTIWGVIGTYNLLEPNNLQSLFSYGVLIVLFIGLYESIKGIKEADRIYSILSDGVLTTSVSRKYSKVEMNESILSYLFYCDHNGYKHGLPDHVDEDRIQNPAEIIYKESDPKISFVFKQEAFPGNYKLIKKLIANARE